MGKANEGVACQLTNKAMKERVNFSDFCDRFHSHDRDGDFSYEGKRALFDHLEKLEEDTGEEIELDIIALCCDYTEYESLDELRENYNDIESLEDLEDHTTVIPIKGTERFIIQNY